MMKRVTVFASLLLASVAFAQPVLDGWDIPNSFADGVELGVQSNATHFGDQLIEVTTSGFAPGSEIDGLYIAKIDNDPGSPDGGYLVVGITGNLEDRGHAIGIFIDGGDLDGWSGQTEMNVELGDGYNRPPQIASYQWVIDTNGTPEDTTDDTWSYGTETTILPFEADYLLFVNHHRGTLYGNEIIMYSSPTGVTHDPTPDNPNDAEADLYGVKTYIGNTPSNDGNEVIEGDASSFTRMGLNNTNVLGVTDTDASNPESATTGFEVAIPLANIGYGLYGDEDIKVFVVLWDGAEGDQEGAIVQTLPTITPCPDPVASVGLYPDMSAASYLTLNLESLPAFNANGILEGDVDSTDYQLPTMADAQALQGCATPYGDQVIEGVEQTIRTQNGSELDVMYAMNDNNNLYIGVTGNLEPNWNRFYLFIDSDPATGVNVLENINEMPNPATLPVDTNGVPVNFDHAYKFGYDAGSYPTGYLDYFDLNTGIKTWIGSLQADSGSGEVTGGANPNGLQMAFGSYNGLGVGGGNPGDGGLFDNGTWMELTTMAYTATEGFEMAIPLADLGLTAADLPRDIHVWAVIWNNNSDWASNQSLPSMRNRTTGGNQTENPGGSPNFFNPSDAAPRNYEAWAAAYTLEGGVSPVDVTEIHSMATHDGVEEGIQIYPAWLNLGASYNCEPRFMTTGYKLEIGLSDVIADASGITVTVTNATTGTIPGTVSLDPAGDKLIATFATLADAKVYTVDVAGDAVNDFQCEFVVLIGNLTNAGLTANTVDSFDKSLLISRLGMQVSDVGPIYDIARVIPSTDGTIDSFDKTMLISHLGLEATN